ncbi:MAG: tRNA (N(6)-L-threonylcarbamoyladenosine(37)-C(2))-methylthiotransferase MtaB [Clostridiales bacterium]|nr:tRNA (N(6)-L-threonylcarbamoyladenosine(37)-C(2))-methylthiotransferase MtaB [Clostridiales bacterium]
MERTQKSAAFLTLGCKVNAYETDAMERVMREAGYRIVDFDQEADVYIINTCTVTNMADRKSRQMLHRAKHKNPHALVVAVGCYVQAAKEALKKDECVDLVVGNNQKNQIARMIEEHWKNQEWDGTVLTIQEQNDYERISIEDAGDKTRAYIKVQDGCNQFCSYCIIPFTRGKLRSRSMEDVLLEVELLAEKGYKEVVITGIHLSSYGVDLPEWKEKAPFLQFTELKGEPLLLLLERLSGIEGIHRIRLGSLEPRIITEEFVSRLSKITKVCPHFHLSLQSGCDDTLKRMNRHYTTKEYLEKLEILRKYYKQPAITTDVIVGFPEETEEEFRITRAFLSKAFFAQMHIFKYSVRKGTKAEKMQQVPEPVKAQRSDCLMELESDMEANYRRLFEGTTQEVLLEEPIRIEGKEYWIGHNERYIKIGIEKTKENEALLESNRIVEVVVNNCIKQGILLGKLC